MNNHLTDEQMVDVIEGNGQVQEAHKHIQTCPMCQESYHSWKEILSQDVHLNDIDRKRVWGDIQRQRQQDDYQQGKRKKRWMYVSWAASCIVFLMFGYWIGVKGELQAQSVDPDSGRIAEFMNEPVQHFNMVSSADGESQGNAWYNPADRQMILYLNDPVNLNDQTGKIQIQTNQKVIPVEPDHLGNGRMQLYVEDHDLRNLIQLIVEKDGRQQHYYFKIESE